MRKFCPHCQMWKPWGAFYAAAKHPDGSMVRPGAYCKPCVAERRRERRQMDPQWARALDKRDWQRIKADPVKLAARRELTRENGIVYRRRHGAEARDTQRRAPIEATALKGAFYASGLSRTELAGRLGVTEKRVRVLLAAERWHPETVARWVHALGIDPVEVAA